MSGCSPSRSDSASVFTTSALPLQRGEDTSPCSRHVFLRARTVIYVAECAWPRWESWRGTRAMVVNSRKNSGTVLQLFLSHQNLPFDSQSQIWVGGSFGRVSAFVLCVVVLFSQGSLILFFLFTYAGSFSSLKRSLVYATNVCLRHLLEYR